MQVLEVLADARVATSLASLSAILELPKTSAMHLLRALEAGRYIRRTPLGFELGSASFRLATKIGPADDFDTTAREVLQDLLDATQETVLLGTFTQDRRSAIYTMRMPSPLPVRFAPEVGGQRPLYSSGIGKVLLAYAAESFVEDYLRNTKLERITAKTVSTRAALRAQLQQVRRAGIAVSIDEMAEGGSALAAPVFDQQKKVHLALIIAAPTSRLLARQAELESILLQATARLSGLRGYTSATI